MEDLYCAFHSYIYQSDDNAGYAILRARVSPGRYVICQPSGCIPPHGLTYGTPLLCSGEYNPGSQYVNGYEHDKCFVCNAIVQTMPADVASAIEFVSNMDIRGIADANARHIIDVTGPDIVSYFWNNPDAKDFKSKIPSLGIAAAEAFIRRIMTTTTQKQMLDAFHQHGATYRDVFRLYQAVVKDVGHECTMDEVMMVLKPHLTNALGQVPHGLYYYGAKADMKFDTIDAMGKQLGYRAYHPERLTSVLLAVMTNFASNGHVWASLNDVYKECKKMSRCGVFSSVAISKWALYATAKIGRGLFVVESDGERIYLESSWFDEHNAVKQLRRIQGSQQVLPYYETIVDEIESEFGVTFSAGQRKCFNFLRKSGIHIVTGGAGTGKTTTISGLLSAYVRLNPSAKIALCAPTGRASQRMTELCSVFGGNVRGATIHKALDFAPFDGEALPTYNEQNPLDADLIIVDEMSMVDLHLFSNLLQAVKNGASIIFCGDVSQLPPVGCGKVFWDLINSKQFETVKLTANYRQANAGNANNIIENSIRINEGNYNLKTGADFEIITRRTDAEMQQVVLDLVKQNGDYTIVTTVRDKSDASVNELNDKLQDIINPCYGGFVKYGNVEFRENDRIIMMRNDYSTGYVNGDVGTIESIAHGEITVLLGGEEKVIEQSNFKDIALAYAMTIHKSQGSEYDSVIVVLPASAPNMWLRNLLYTAVTRAKKHVVIVCQPDAIEYAVKNTKTADRRTTLKELLCS